MLRSLLVCATKEFRVLVRDREGLAILFLMPTLFVVIMSLALRDFFQQDAAPRFSLVVVDGDGDRLGRELSTALAGSHAFKIETRAAPDWLADKTRVRAEVNAANLRFALLVPPGTSAAYAAALSHAANTADADPAAAPPAVVLEFLADPAVRADLRALAVATIDRVLAGIELHEIVAQFGSAYTAPPSADSRGILRIVDASGTAAPGTRSTSTQQNVPAYMLLAIFMLVVPLSGTFIKERAQGSLTRLRSMPVPGIAIIGGKILPYLGVNLVQVALCMAVGRYLLPALGGDALAFGHSYAGIVLLTLATSIAAIGFGLAIAMVARTPEQATAFGATAVLIFAALGGVMVPTMVMPPVMVSIGAWSPIGWALAGYLDLFVRDTDFLTILPRAGALVLFGFACIAFALARFSWL